MSQTLFSTKHFLIKLSVSIFGQITGIRFIQHIESQSDYQKFSIQSVCEVGTVGKIFDYQPEGSGFNPRPGREFNFGRPSFTTPTVDRDVKPLV